MTAADGAANDRFGVSVALSADGQTACIGAYYDDTAGGGDAGSAYIFTRTAGVWNQQAKLTAADGAANDYFGFRVALSADGQTACIGAYLDDTAGGANAGSAYVFTASGGVWSHQARLTAADGAAGDYFGISVALSADGQTACIGAYLDDTAGGVNAGSAYVFTASGGVWSQQARLTAADGAANDRFGYSVALSADGQTACIGAYLDDTAGGGDAGSAYVFTASGGVWTQQAQLTAADGAANDYFGYSVALSADGQTACIGAYLDDTAGGVNAGSVYIFN